MRRRLASLILIVAMLLGLAAPFGTFAAEPELLSCSGSADNPLYASSAPPESPEPQAGSLAPVSKAGGYLTVRAAADVLREAMIARESDVTLAVHVPNFWNRGEYDNWFVAEFFPMTYSLELAKCPYDGDYLMWSWRHYDWSVESRSGQDFVFQLSLIYYSTAEDEQAVADRVAELAGALGLSDMTPREAYEAIYDFVTTHVSYDHDAQKRITAKTPLPEDYYIFTAYGALIRGQAVCQGFATLYYALCREAGLPVRIVTSFDHAWNIVYLKGIWYETDCTGDASTETHRKWFLVGSQVFEIEKNHISSRSFRTEAFRAAYPISKLDYDPDSPYNDVSRNSTHYASILRATELGLFQGTGTYTFSPDEPVSRAMLITTLWRMSGAPGPEPGERFFDVSPEDWYYDAANWARDSGISQGTGGYRLQPMEAVTRAQAATMLLRYAEKRGLDTASDTTVLGGYQDSGDVPPWAAEALAWGLETGIITASTRSSLGDGLALTRAELASTLIRFLAHYDLASGGVHT